MKSKALFYCYLSDSSFVKRDIEILEGEFELVKFKFNASPLALLGSFFRQMVWLILKGSRCSVFVCQFGGYHSFLPALFASISGKKMVIVLAGVDCVSLPEINYGLNIRFPIKFFNKWSIKLSHLLLPVYDSLISENYTYLGDENRKVGLQTIIPVTNLNYKVVYFGFDSNKWRNLSAEKSTLSFCTVGAGLNSRFGFQLKGIDLIYEVAPYFPSCTFNIVGGEGLPTPPSPNIKLLPRIENNSLPEFLSTQTFYLQLSMSEGFPNALCEAMLCECVPIVSNTAAMPFIVKDTGFILKYKSGPQLVEVINEAISTADIAALGKSARARVAEHFTLEKRQKSLIDGINSLL